MTSDRLGPGATNKGADFLLELLSEEIPARMQAKARNDLARMMAEALAAAGLSHDGIITYSTPRRLALIARGLPAATEAVSEELKGPKTAAPQQALDGFLRKTGLTQEQLEDRDGTWFAVIERPAQATETILAIIVAEIVRNFPWPKSMRWGAASSSTESLRWVRPLQSVVALLGREIVPVRLAWIQAWEQPDGSLSKTIIDAGIEAGASTLGHRFHHPGPITIGGAHDYVEKLRACHVLVDHAEREDLVRKGALIAAEDAGFMLVEDEGLVVENAGLTEYPVPLAGAFDPDYLDVPPEVIQLTARTNQKYFVMRDGAGALAPGFVCVANIDANDGGAAIVAGNERVLAARLSDARFFWEQDLKIPLEEQAKKLEQIVFHEKLGTIADKVERVAKLAEWLASEKIVPNCDPKLARRAAEFSKADLVTGMVGEFPELQGVIGGYLARAQGENDAVADAIRDHYKPVGQGDEVPTAPVTVAVSLADKLDTLVSFFVANELPTGSKDPFALRRAAISLEQMIIENDLRVGLRSAVRASAEALFNQAAGQIDYDRDSFDGEPWKTLFLIDRDDSSAKRVAIKGPIQIYWRKQFAEAAARDGLPNLQNFFADRFKVHQRETGIRHDLIDAVFALGGEDDLVRLLARVKALQAFVETGEGANLLAAYKRTANILKQAGEFDPHAAAPGAMSPVERALLTAVDHVELRATNEVQTEKFGAAMSALSTLREPIDAFFDGVMINDPDPEKRAFRLGMLARFRDAVHAVADFSKIDG